MPRLLYGLWTKHLPRAQLRGLRRTVQGRMMRDWRLWLMAPSWILISLISLICVFLLIVGPRTLLVFAILVLSLLARAIEFKIERKLWNRHARKVLAENKLCSGCAYDIRNIPDRCPECGAPVPTDIERIPLG